jgi:hypothetical protein
LTATLSVTTATTAPAAVARLDLAALAALNDLAALIALIASPGLGVLLRLALRTDRGRHVPGHPVKGLSTGSGDATHVRRELTRPGLARSKARTGDRSWLSPAPAEA